MANANQTERWSTHDDDERRVEGMYEKDLVNLFRSTVLMPAPRLGDEELKQEIKTRLGGMSNKALLHMVHGLSSGLWLHDALIEQLQLRLLQTSAQVEALRALLQQRRASIH